MSFATITTYSQDGTAQVDRMPLPEEKERGVVTGFYKNGPGGSQVVLPYFYLAAAGEVEVTTQVQGDVRMSLPLFNRSHSYPGPTLEQSGGRTHLGPGQWELSFLGSIGQGRIDVTVHFPG